MRGRGGFDSGTKSGGGSKVSCLRDVKDEEKILKQQTIVVLAIVSTHISK